MSSARDLRDIALAEFAIAGYSGTSLHRIADLAGLSKSAVLYHYASKEALLEAAITPALETLGSMLDDLAAGDLSTPAREDFLLRFIDFVLEYRRELHLFINQGPSLDGVPVIDRANDLIRSLAEYFASNVSSTEDKMRFGIALGGTAYTLCVADQLGLQREPVEETRAALRSILPELLAPVRTTTIARATSARATSATGRN